MSTRRSAALVALLLALTACPSRSPAPTKSPSASPSATQPAGPAEGEIRIAYPWEPPTLNPFTRSGDAPAVRELVSMLMPPLFRSLPGGRSEPWLVKSIETETATEVRFTLREDARWSDGKPITSADVAFTWRTIMDRRAPIASRDGYEALTAVEGPSPATVVFRFATAFPRWRDLFSGGLGVLPEHALKGQDVSKALAQRWPVSGGPYILTHYTRGLELIFEASPNPWRVQPSIKRIRVQFVPDATTALQLFRAGKVDVLGPYSSGDFARRAALEPDAVVTTDTGAAWAGVVLNASAGVLSDVRVRRAFAMSTDRDSLVSGLVRSEGLRLHTPFASPDVQGTAIGYDVAQAGALLDDAGFTDRRGGIRRKGSTELTVSLTSVSGDDVAARLIRGLYYRLRDAGFDVNIVELEYEQLYRDWLPSGRMQAAFVRFVDPPGGSLRARYATSQRYPSGVNYARVGDGALDATLDDPAAAASKLAELVPVIPLYRVAVPAVASKKLSGVRASAAADGFLASAWEWRLAG